jgi:hypothetical protein
MLPSVDLRARRGDYGYDASLTDLLPRGIGGVVLALLAVFQRARGHRRAASIELACGLTMLLTLGVYLHTTRRGKFAVWAEILKKPNLRGDERVLDVGCGRAL